MFGIFSKVLRDKQCRAVRAIQQWQEVGTTPLGLRESFMVTRGRRSCLALSALEEFLRGWCPGAARKLFPFQSGAPAPVWLLAWDSAFRIPPVGIWHGILSGFQNVRGKWAGSSPERSTFTVSQLIRHQ